MLFQDGAQASSVQIAIDTTRDEIDELRKAERRVGVRSECLLRAGCNGIHGRLRLSAGLGLTRLESCEPGRSGSMFERDPRQPPVRAAHGSILSGGYARPESTQEWRVTEADCLFCKIVDGSIPTEIVARTDRAVAFRDINPQAPVHVLVIPTEHVASVGMARDEHRELLGDVLLLARDVARSQGVAEAGFRVVLNTGDHGGQTVHHIHAHVLGGRPFSWPPG